MKSVYQIWRYLWNNFGKSYIAKVSAILSGRKYTIKIVKNHGFTNFHQSSNFSHGLVTFCQVYNIDLMALKGPASLFSKKVLFRKFQNNLHWRWNYTLNFHFCFKSKLQIAVGAKLSTCHFFPLYALSSFSS